MDIRKIKKLIKLVAKFKISELEISEGEESIRISYSSSCYSSPTQQDFKSSFPSSFYNEENNIENNSHSKLKKEETSKTNQDHSNYNDKENKKNYLIRSPMVGIFYYISHQDSKPFVQIGQKINIGDILCVIEAMKMMNQIQSENSGIIKSIFPNNGQPVEFNEPLFLIEKK